MKPTGRAHLNTAQYSAVYAVTTRKYLKKAFSLPIIAL